MEKSAVARPQGTEEALRSSIRDIGVVFPVLITEEGIMIDGELRKRIADELGVPCPARTVRRVRDLRMSFMMEEIRLRHEAEKHYMISSGITKLASMVDADGVGLWSEVVIAAAMGVSVEHVLAHMRRFLTATTKEDIRELFPRERRTVDGGTAKAAVTTADLPPPVTERPPLHEVLEYIPEVSPDEMDALRKDIKTNGLRQPVLLDAKGRLVDGRARWAICAAMGIVPDVTIVAGDAWKASLEANRARFPAMWDRIVLATSLPSRNSPTDHRYLTALQVADILRVPHHSVGSLRRIIALGVPELVEAITGDKIRLGSVQKIVKNFPREQWIDEVKRQIDANPRVRPVRPITDSRPRSSKGAIGAAHILKILEQLDALGLVLDSATGLDPAINSADAAQWLAALSPRRTNLTRLTQMLKQRKEST